MNLPNVDVFPYLNALLSWAPIAIFIAVSMAAAAAGVVVALFMRAFMRG